MSNNIEKNGSQSPLRQKVAPTPLSDMRSKKVTSSTDKQQIKICRNFIWGICTKGNQCKYRHELELESMKSVVRFCHDFQNKTGCTRVGCTYLHTSRAEEDLFLATGVIPKILIERHTANYSNLVTSEGVPYPVYGCISQPPPPPPFANMTLSSSDTNVCLTTPVSTASTTINGTSSQNAKMSLSSPPSLNPPTQQSDSPQLVTSPPLCSTSLPSVSTPPNEPPSLNTQPAITVQPSSSMQPALTVPPSPSAQPALTVQSSLSAQPPLTVQPSLSAPPSCGVQSSLGTPPIRVLPSLSAPPSLNASSSVSVSQSHSALPSINGPLFCIPPLNRPPPPLHTTLRTLFRETQPPPLNSIMFDASRPPPPLPPNIYNKNYSLKRPVEPCDAGPSKMKKLNCPEVDNPCEICIQRELRIDVYLKDIKKWESERDVQMYLLDKQSDEHDASTFLLKTLIGVDIFNKIEEEMEGPTRKVNIQESVIKYMKLESREPVMPRPFLTKFKGCVQGDSSKLHSSPSSSVIVQESTALESLSEFADSGNYSQSDILQVVQDVVHKASKGKQTNASSSKDSLAVDSIKPTALGTNAENGQKNKNGDNNPTVSAVNTPNTCSNTSSNTPQTYSNVMTPTSQSTSTLAVSAATPLCAYLPYRPIGPPMCLPYYMSTHPLGSTNVPSNHSFMNGPAQRGPSSKTPVRYPTLSTVPSTQPTFHHYGLTRYPSSYHPHCP